MAERSNSWIWIAAAIAVFLLIRHQEIGRRAPEFALHGAYGGEYHLDSFRGKPVLLVFWSTNCGICRHELPILESMYAEATRAGVEIAAVNIADVDGAREVMRPMHMLNLIDPDGSAAHSFGVSGVPKLVLVGADGKIKHSQSGLAREDTLRAWFHS